MDQIKYAGFWIRTAATIVDSILLLAIVVPVLTLIYGGDYWLGGMNYQSLWDVLFALVSNQDHWKGGMLFHGFWDILLNIVFPLLAVILFWQTKSATPGKMLLGLTIVDARTGNKPTLWQFLVRYFAYLIAILPFFLGLLWVAIDEHKQGWHDKLANTLVVRRGK